MTRNGTHTYAHNAEGRILFVDGGSTAQYVYNALSQRVREALNGSVANEYAFNAAGQRVAEWTGDTAHPDNTLVQGKYYLGAKPVAFYKNGATYFEHQDWLGTERLRTTYNGGVEGSYTSLPFGDGLTTTAGAACRRCGNCDTAKPAKARENCDSWGISRRLSQPQMRRKQGSLCSRSSNCRVWPRL